MGRDPTQVDQDARRLALDMNRIALANESSVAATRLPDSDTPAVERLDQLDLPVLVIVGSHDIPYMLAAADFMEAHIAGARKVVMEDAAHLANMDHPTIFRQAVEAFLET
jgi:3-oxoadipate enol-lactonase